MAVESEGAYTMNGDDLDCSELDNGSEELNAETKSDTKMTLIGTEAEIAYDSKSPQIKDETESEKKKEDESSNVVGIGKETCREVEREIDIETTCGDPPIEEHYENENGEDKKENTESREREDDTAKLLIELQASLQRQIVARAESENKLRCTTEELHDTQVQYKQLKQSLDVVTKELEEKSLSLSNVDNEVVKLRQGREDYERKEALLQNRLNEAKKKEASKASLVSRYETENANLKESLQKEQQDFVEVSEAKNKMEQSIEKLKKKCVERVKATEAALTEERNLNDERKRKMKIFVETKAEELRYAKSANDELRSELKETDDALHSVREKLEYMTKQYELASTRNRELLRDMNRMKKNSEQLHQLGDNLELELHRSAQETEEHKNKRLTAKHELMTVVRKLEAEQAVSEKLRDSVKFTFTPKALSQQQLLNEILHDFELELLKLSSRLGKPLPLTDNTSNPSYSNGFDGNVSENTNGSHANNEGDVAVMNIDNSTSSGTGTSGGMKRSGGRINRSEWDTARLLTNLENETQMVSKCIMSLTGAVEQLHGLLLDSGERTCVSAINDVFLAIAAINEQGGLPNSDSKSDRVASNTSDDMFGEEEVGVFAGVHQTCPETKNEHYGLVNSND